MALVVSPSEYDVEVALRSFLLAYLPSGTEVVLGYVNLVPEPASENFVVMLPIMRGRLSTNVDSYLDCAFTGSVDGVVLTVSEIEIGVILVNANVYAAGIPNGVTIIAQLSGAPGGVGTYNLSQDCSTLPAMTVQTGQEIVLQPTMVTMQCDCHGDAAADLAQTISTLFRDLRGADFFETINGGAIQPLYTDDAKLIPFLNEGQQIETRWTISVMLQVNQTVSNLQQAFADELVVTTINVEATYPAS